MSTLVKHQNPLSQLKKQRLLLVFKDWIFTLLPFLLSITLGLTVFREAVIASIRSTPHPGLVYAIMFAMLVGMILICIALDSYVRERNLLWEWQTTIKQQRSEQLQIRVEQSQLAPVLQIIEGHWSIHSAERHARLEHELQNLSNQLDSRLVLPNYLAGALVGMGLVGTFIGLLAALEDLSKLFAALMNTGNANMDPTAIFADMLRQLQEPMRGMGTAFVASLYGLLGSLILGLNSVTVSKVGQRLVEDINAMIREQRDQALLSDRQAVAQTVIDPETALQLYRDHIEQLHNVFEQLNAGRLQENIGLTNLRQDMLDLYRTQQQQFTELSDQLSQDRRQQNTAFSACCSELTTAYVEQIDQLDTLLSEQAIRYDQQLKQLIHNQDLIQNACLEQLRQFDHALQQWLQERLEQKQQTQENARQLETLVRINQDLADGLVMLGQTVKVQAESLQMLPEHLQNLEKILTHHFTGQHTLTLTVNPVNSLKME